MTRELSDETRSLIRAAVADEPRPDRAHRARLRRELRVRATAAAALTFAGTSVAKAAGGSSVLSTVASFLGLGFGAGLVLAGAAQVVLNPRAVPAETDRSVALAQHARLSRAQAVIAPPLAESVASATPEPHEVKRVDDDAALEPASSKARAPGGAAPAGASAAPSSSLRAELDLMAQVQGALRDGRAARALELIARYDLQYPGGSLANERLAAEVFAACSIGDPARARRVAAAFLARDNVSALAGRVKKSCLSPSEGVP